MSAPVTAQVPHSVIHNDRSLTNLNSQVMTVGSLLIFHLQSQHCLDTLQIVAVRSSVRQGTRAESAIMAETGPGTDRKMFTDPDHQNTFSGVFKTFLNFCKHTLEVQFNL